MKCKQNGGRNDEETQTRRNAARTELYGRLGERCYTAIAQKPSTGCISRYSSVPPNTLLAFIVVTLLEKKMNGQAEQLKCQIDEYLRSPVSEAAANQLKNNRNAIDGILKKLNQTEFSVAFIGKIGAGKTSAICKTSGLQYKDEKGEIVDILKTGAGRTTVCEVRIEFAPKISIKIEPLPSDDVMHVVQNFSEFIWNKAKKNIADDDEGGNLLSEELTRCIRNMLGLTIERKKADDGKLKSSDKAVELAKNCDSLEQLKELMYECLELDKRTENELWPNESEVKNWQSWLKEHFAQVNDGKNKSISIPSLITINGPFPLENNGCKWKVIDTKGIDSNIRREDIRQILDTEEIFPVICSSFVDAPDADCRSFFDLGVGLNLAGRIERDAILLVLDKNESDKVSDIPDDESDPLERKNIGRSIREDQVITKISHEYKISPNILTFDSRCDDESIMWQSISERKLAYLNSKKSDLERLISASNELLSAETEKIQSFKRDIKTLTTEWRNNADTHSPDWKNFGDYVKKMFTETHHRTLAACIDRKGAFYNLHIYELINQRARKVSNLFCKAEIEFLQGEISILRDKYPEFINQINSLEHDYIAQFNQFSSYVGDVSKKHWIEQVQTCFGIWGAMNNEWGAGSGYKQRVLKHWENWLVTEDSKKIHQSLLRQVASAWGRVLVEKQG